MVMQLYVNELRNILRFFAKQTQEFRFELYCLIGSYIINGPQREQINTFYFVNILRFQSKVNIEKCSWANSVCKICDTKYENI